MTPPLEARRFVAVCTAGCRLYGPTGADLGPRPLEALELAAHDDRHLASKVRVLVRMLRDASPEVREQVLEYCLSAFPVYAENQEEHNHG